MFNRRYLPFISSTLLLLAGVSVCGAQEYKPPASQEASNREAWRKSMVRVPLPKKGCFNATYPKTEWKEAPCTTAPDRPYRPSQGTQGRGGKPEDVGNLSGDFSAVASGTVTSAEGSFNSVTGVTSATSSSYSLQLNTNRFTTTACNNVAGCVGWEQFVFDNTGCGGNPCIFIQTWLIGIGATCPTGAGWLQTSGAPNDCFKNSVAANATSQTITNLVGLTVTGQASGGTDTIISGSSSGNLTATAQDSVLNLETAWNTAEFNAFGNGNFAQLAFNAGSTVVVKTSVVNGSTSPPTCFNHSFTGETNNLSLANVTGTTTLVCCPYGGASPNIQFMETNAGHTATCGATRLIGDPHITTADGAHYDFQGAGEYVSLRAPSGEEVQTRQTPVSTTFIGTDNYDGITSCVSLNTAVATRVGEHRVTYEPNLSGVPDPSGMQLRIDGVLTALGPQGRDLGNGGRVFLSSSGGILEIDFPDGKTVFVTPEWWASQSKWYLNVDVAHVGLVTSGGGNSTGGIAGPLADGSWLPALPNGTSLGPMPGPVQDRYLTLYRKFGDAWRVTNKDSLFDYAPGTSTGTFTMREWPPEHGPCVVPNMKPVEPATEEFAQAACRRVSDKNMHADCVFDVRATGDAGFAKTYLTTQRVLAYSTSISLKDDPEPSQAGEWVTFTAFVAASSSEVSGFPSGTVQFTVDGTNVGTPIKVDAEGRAIWETSQLKAGKHRVSASFLSSPGSLFLPSTSVEKLHVVKRCFCAAEHEYK